MSMGKRLQEALDLRQRTAPDVIAGCRLSKGAVYNILNDTTKPEKVRAETVAKIAGFLGVSRDWLVWGKGMPDDAELGADDGWADISSVLSISSSRGKGNAAQVEGPQLLRVPLDSLRRNGLEAADLAVLNAENGTAILFDTTDVVPRDEKRYVVSMGGALAVRRLVSLGDQWFVSIDGPSESTRTKPLPIRDIADFAIHGRVRWVGTWED